MAGQAMLEEMAMFHKVLIALSLILFSATSFAQTTLLFNSFLPPGHVINTKVLQPWAKRVSEATDGRVKIKFAPKSVAGPPSQMRAVESGIVDGAYMYQGFLSKQAKLTQIAQLPFVNTTAKGSSIALWKTYDKFFKDKGEFDGVHVLSFFVFNGSHIYSLDGPIESMSDIKGSKVFSIPGVPANFMKAAGAGVMAGAAARSQSIISSGTVDAFVGTPLMDVVALNLAHYVDNVTLVPGYISAPSFVLFVNKKVWNGLSDEDRKAITSLSGENFAERSSVYDKMDAQAMKKLKAEGVGFNTAQGAFYKKLRKIGKPILDKWKSDADALGVDADAALAYYKKVADQYK